MDREHFLNNRSNQLNPNNWRFWKSRGFLERPQNWIEIISLVISPNTKVLPFAAPWMEAFEFKAFENTLENTLYKGIQLFGKTVGICCHGLMKLYCYMCTIKGLIIFVGVTSFAIILYNYPKELKEYALKGLNTTGNLCRYSADLVKKNSILLYEYSAYSAKFLYDQGPNILHYGIVVPYISTKTGVYYTGIGLKKLASVIGYYSGFGEKEKADEYTTKCN